MPPILPDLLAALPRWQCDVALPNIAIHQVVADSRQVQPGSLFVAIRGGMVDGHRYIPDAIARGAAAVVGTDATPPWLPGAALPYVRVDDGRLALATLSAALHGFPGRSLRLVGVTGTDGKTTTCNLLYQILLAGGQQPGMISTIGARVGGLDLDTGLHVTTPDAPDVQRYLAHMAQAGCRVAVLEATSHGLHQGRLTACDFDVAVVTNVTHEHLDYHGDWDAYLDAKGILFRSLATSARKPGQPKVAVLNADDPSFPRLRPLSADQHLTYGLEAGGLDITARQIEFRPDLTTFVLHTPGGSLLIATRLVGRFNVYNCLAATGAGLGLGLSLEAIAQGIAALGELGVEGRMQRIDRGQDFLAIVDFAHTPAALARALEAARLMTAGRVIVVFGSAGLRDVQKRTLMADTAVRLADLAVLTAEDPRTEPLDGILQQMAEGARRAGGHPGRQFEVVADRVAAIERAVALARPGDVVLVCGKGHERSMCFGAVEYPWRDQDVVAWAIEKRLGITQAPPPFVLPTTQPSRE